MHSIGTLWYSDFWGYSRFWPNSCDTDLVSYHVLSVFENQDLRCEPRSWLSATGAAKDIEPGAMQVRSVPWIEMTNLVIV